MYIKVIMFLAVFFNIKLSFSQLKIEINNFINGEEKYSNLPSQFKESILKTYDVYYYDNGQKLEKYIYNDSNEIDSIYRYHLDGSIALEAKIIYKLPIQRIDFLTSNKYNQISCSYYTKTYYQDSNIRSIQLYGFTDVSKFSINKYFDLNSDLVYEEIQITGDKIKGTFNETYYNEDNISTYSVYENGNLKEVWTIKNTNEKNKYIIINILIVGSNKLIEKPRKIKSKYKKTPLIMISNRIYVKNGKGNKFEDIKSSKINYIMK